MAANAVSFATLPRACVDAAVWHELVSRQKDFRLLSLRMAPDAFSSTYDREQHFTWETWENRLRNAQATTFVAVSSELGTGSDTHGSLEVKGSLRREWLGQLVLLKCTQDDRAKLSANKSPWHAPSGRETADDISPHYQFNAMFVVPSARGQGIARKLIKHALTSSRAGASKNPKYTAIVWAKNEAARRTFEGCGFKVVGEEMHPNGSQEQPQQELALTLEYGLPS